MIKLNTLKVIQLNALLRANNIQTTCTKIVKVAKLQEVLGADEVDPMELEDDGAVSANDVRVQLNSLREAMASLTSATMNRNSLPIPANDQIQQASNNNDGVRPDSSLATWESADDLRTASRPKMRIQDMIGVMPEFDPLKSSTSAMKFINRTQQLQQCYGWKEDMVLIAVQHKMKGMGKQWLNVQDVFSSWSQFMHAFTADFPSAHNAAETHKALMKRKRKPNEDYLEYYYSTLTIGRQCKVDDVSINTHIVGGLNDSVLTKTLATMNFATCSQLVNTTNTTKLLRLQKWWSLKEGDWRLSLTPAAYAR
uniref:Retrotransposon gag domain-containing protein n=1 Tax=Bactrocera latifrons TaxID=174628 RepID=A0A0K8VK38_BACLA